MNYDISFVDSDISKDIMQDIKFIFLLGDAAVCQKFY